MSFDKSTEIQLIYAHEANNKANTCSWNPCGLSIISQTLSAFAV